MKAKEKVLKLLRHAMYGSKFRFTMEISTPYMLYKDACNSKSNQKNLGTINLVTCIEIVEYSNDEETAVCNLFYRFE